MPKRKPPDGPDVRHEIIQRIDKFWTKNNVAQDKEGFWTPLGIGWRQYYTVQRGRSRASEPSASVIAAISKKYDKLNLDWLLKGGPDSEMLKNLSVMIANRPENYQQIIDRAVEDAQLIERCLDSLRGRLRTLGAQDSLTKLKPNESKEGELPKILEDQRTPDPGANNRK